MAVGWQDVATELVETRYGALVGYATMLTGSLPDAEDAVHDALMATFGKRRNLPNVAAAEGYVRRAIATKHVDGARRAVRERAAVHRIAAQPASDVAGPEAGVANRSAVETALMALSPQERACVVSRHLDQLTTAETAAFLGLAEGSVKRYVFDGMRKLGQVMAVDVDVDALEWTSVQPTKGGVS
jgi:RNA polymerase sigma factor (sigma-70 family)